MFVVATAGHVDHGKSALLRALTGMEPDRWAEERRRGMTLDLGFVWTTLDDGSTVAFVDVPGHERFVPTMLAGAGPVPAVLLVVAADEGWRAQTEEHVAVLDALGVAHGLLVVTRADLADPRPAADDALARLERTGLGRVEAVAVSSVTGQGLDALRAALARLVARLPAPRDDGRLRLFVDRSFTIRGSGTVVTGTLGSGRVRVGDAVQLVSRSAGGRTVVVRGLQRLGLAVDEVCPVARLAVNLRGVAPDEVPRGSALVTPDAWPTVEQVDARLSALGPGDLPGDLVLHLGTAGVPCRVRPLGHDTCRVTLASPLPLQPGDRAVLRDPSRRLVTGLVVLDVEPPPLTRRGAARARGEELAGLTGAPDVRREVVRRGAVTRAHLAVLGVLPPEAPLPPDLEQVGEYVVDPATWRDRVERLVGLVDVQRVADSRGPGPGAHAVAAALGLPDQRLVAALVAASQGRLRLVRGRVVRARTAPSLDDAVQGALEVLRRRLDADPFDAPCSKELAAAGLTTPVVVAAAEAGLLVRLRGEVLVAASAPDRALDVVAGLAQPFTLAEARDALGTSRRVALPLLEHLDETGRTVRVGDRRRVIARADR